MRRNVQPFPVSVLDQADNPRRLVLRNDGSEVRLCSYPYATALDGIPWWVQSYRLSGPPHRFESQSLQWGLCITPASGGEESHLYLPQVIKIYNLDLSSPANRPFRENGSQLRPVPSFPRLREWDVTPTDYYDRMPCTIQEESGTGSIE